MIPTPWKIAGAALAVVLLIAAALWYVSAERAKAYAAGEASERAKWQAREAEELAAAHAALVAAQSRAATLERQAAEQLAALDADHLQKEKALEARHDRFVADLYAGRIRVRSDIASACQGAHGGAPGAPAAAAGMGDGEAPGDLPGALREAVAGGHALAREADQVALQLEGAQAYIETALRTCNPP